MNKAALAAVAVTVLFLAGIVVCQNDPGSNSNKMSPEINQDQLQLRTVVGCLSKTANTYVITGGAPGPKQFRIVGGDTSSLRGRIGHTVKVVGLVGGNDGAENMVTPYNEGSTTGVGYNTIIAQEIKEIYENCSEPGKEYSGNRK
ncbi:MAG: hypothetical protein NVS1B11_29250 [Terriglobales bacterium]